MTEYFANSDSPVPEVLTAKEACRYLRLDEGRSMANALKALRRLVDRRVLRPCRLGRHNRFSRYELSRLVAMLTDQNDKK